MNAEERRRLLLAMTSLSHREAEYARDLQRVFLPLPAHRLALRPEVVIVRGGRGAGKSALFRLLGELRTTERIRGYFDDERLPEAIWIEAFAQSSHHPQDALLDPFGEGRSEGSLRAFWMAHLLLRVVEEQPGLVEPPADLRAAWLDHRSDPERWVPLAEQRLGAVASALDQAERELTRRGRTLFATYDHLDRLGTFQPVIRRRYVASLLALWLSLSNRYRAIRAKIFLREDLLDASELGFPDASKLRARSVSLDWDVESLYRAAVRHMAEASPELRVWLLGIKHGFRLDDEGGTGFMPGPMPEEVQKAFADRLAGEVMGAGTRKGYTYRWIPNHIQDAQNRVVPRSILVLLGGAATEAVRNPLTSGSRLMRPQDLAQALEETSAARAEEIVEEYKLVNRLLHLRGFRVPLDRAEAMERLGMPVEGERAGLSRDGYAVLDELRRLGVLALRPDGRVDVPDIYRFGFGILRKGGVGRPR